MSIVILKNLQNKKIAILGLGIENYALVKFLIPLTPFIKGAKFDITICDARSKKELGERYKDIEGILGVGHPIGRPTPLIKWQLGKNYNKNLYEFDILFRSPGWPVNKVKSQKSLKSPNPLYQGGIIVSSPMKLFFELCPSKNIIGVTGTKGKGTTAYLIYKILKKTGKSVWLGGNIGVAPFEFLGKIKRNDWVVLELSSFQLEDMEVSPYIAVITNFYSEHLAPADPNNPNFHKTLKDYRDAKMNIIRWQRRGDYAVINKNFQFSPASPSEAGRAISNFQLNFKKLKSKIIYFGKSDLPSKLIGEHNKENIAAAVEVAKIIGIKNEIIRKAVAGFKGLEHRLEFVKAVKAPLVKGGWGVIKYYNDSFATTSESAIIALKSFPGPVILLVGGAEKNSDFRPLAREIKRGVYPVKSSKAGAPLQARRFNRVKFVVLLDGKATGRIKRELLQIKYPKDKIKLAQSMKDAVRIARSVAKAGDTVLLSPACASFGMFKNYKERGELFKEEVKK